VQGDITNNFYFRQFFIKCRFVSTINEIARLTPTMLGKLALQCMEPQNHSSVSVYTLSTFIQQQLHCVGQIKPTQPAPLPTVLCWATPFPRRGGGGECAHSQSIVILGGANSPTCSRVTHWKTGVRGRVKNDAWSWRCDFNLLCLLWISTLIYYSSY
jgi:hypothetical protein